MSKKPHKVGEPKATYAAKKPAEQAPVTSARYADPAKAKQSMDKVFRVHKELLRKLAQ